MCLSAAAYEEGSGECTVVAKFSLHYTPNMASKWLGFVYGLQSKWDKRFGPRMHVVDHFVLQFWVGPHLLNDPQWVVSHGLPELS